MYNFKNIEEKWQKCWQERKNFNVGIHDFSKPKYYVLVEFPYPSGAGLHVGHVRSYTALDSLARKRRMEGYNVLFPMGWDAFGSPAEQYAIKNHIHPKDAVKENIKTFKGQIQSLGISFDWSREFATTDPEYYKWTQWQFLKFYEHGLAYKDKKAINWCPNCKVGLSNEDSSGGVCERCGTKVVQKEKEQWMLRMSDYAEQLLEGLNDNNFQERIKTAQINWIGKSVGAEVKFKIENSDETLTVFTTRPDTLYGVTFMVVAPEHPIIDKFASNITNINEINQYKEEAASKSEFERVELVKEKTGVKINGIHAVNPVSGEKVEIWVADYVMMGYGTGAIMAVPAHDERDFAFATKFGIPLRPVISQITGEKRENEIYKKSIVAVVYDPKQDKYLTINWGDKGGRLFIGGTRKDDEDIVECARREIAEETGYVNLKYSHSTASINHHYYAYNKNKAYVIDAIGLYLELETNNTINCNLDEEEKNNFTVEWVSKEVVTKEIVEELHKTVYENLVTPKPYTGDGVMINSDILNGIDNKKEAIDMMIQYLEEKGIGVKKTNYRLQDWIFSRQRFWGEPIPMIHCDHCGWVPVPEKDLPVVLPDVTEYEPTDNGESPLSKIKEWVHVKCPKCGADAERETDTMPNWAGSSWYWLRYMDPNNNQEFVSQDTIKYWGKVDWYNGGMEHATRHLLYARFWNQFLYNIGLVPNKEPFEIRTAHGMILGSNGEKMSKSKGNVINPTDIVNEVGADALRVYEMFIGDYERDAAWSINGLKGCKRFLDRIWRLQETLNEKSDYTNESLVHKTIKKVTNDIETMKYNTAVSALMIMLNEYEDMNSITKEDYRVLLHLLNPIAPHITEELNELNHLGNPLCESSWPTYDEEKTQDETFELIVQVNGKVRGKMTVNSDTTEEEMKALAHTIDNVNKFLEGHEIIKVITIPKRLVNIVIK